ncbi:hypothetical protein [Streptomyces sp. NPDC046870]|uniref:hypothetical protein n=1 Tax=Streptomyces sp. NPDC046870 TaxID=3155135 RepID=UPI003455698D
MQDPDPAVRGCPHDRVGSLRDDPAARVRIPSVSADPAHERDVTWSARRLQARLREHGLQAVGVALLDLGKAHPAPLTYEAAMSRTVQRPAPRIRNGGGASAALPAEATHAPVLFNGTGRPEDHRHDCDEKAEVQAQRAETLAYPLGDLCGRLRG